MSLLRNQLLRRVAGGVLPLLCILAAARTEAQCTPADVTNIVHVQFRGCTLPADDIPVTIGDEEIVLNKPPGQPYWRGETAQAFRIADGHLTSVEIKGFRTMCNVRPAADSAGACVAKYVVSCEPLWSLNVKTFPEGVRATIDYERQPTTKTVESCLFEKKGQKSTPYVFDIGSEKMIFSTTSITGTALRIELTSENFRAKPEWKLSDLVAFVVAQRAANKGGPNLKELHQLTAENILFVKQ